MIAASVRTRVVSWNEAADKKDSVANEALVIPKSVTQIDKYAFSNCSSLASIKVETGNTIYDSRKDCNAIIETATNTLVVACKNTFIPNSVISIGFRAFSGSDITSINIPKSVTSINGSAFANCKKLTSIVVKRGNRTFDSRNNCNAIIHTSTNTLVAGCKNTIIPKTVTTIGYHSFSECANLTSITIPKSVTKIDDWAFANCGDLTSITIPKTVREIGEDVFQGCTELTSVALSRSVTKIRRGTFANCLSLTSITIPYSVTEIEESAFLNCPKLKTVTIMNSNAKIDENAFEYCGNVKVMKGTNAKNSTDKKKRRK